MTTPHLSLPFRFSENGAVVVEQGSTDDLAVCVEVLVSTRPSEIEEVPSYGLADPVFLASADVPAIVAAVRAWVPKADTATVTAVLARTTRIELTEDGGGA